MLEPEIYMREIARTIARAICADDSFFGDDVEW